MSPEQLAVTPAGVPPPGVIPNHINPHSNGPILIGVGSVLVALMMVFVVVRGYTKFMIVGKPTPDDCECEDRPHIRRKTQVLKQQIPASWLRYDHLPWPLDFFVGY